MGTASIHEGVRRMRFPAPKMMGGHRPYLLEKHRDWLLSRMRGKPDLTLLAELEGRGISVSCGTLWRFLVRAGISLKKPSSPASRIGLDVARRRARW